MTNERFEGEKEGEITIKRLKTIENHHKQLQASFGTLCTRLNCVTSPMYTKKSEISRYGPPKSWPQEAFRFSKKCRKSGGVSKTGPETWQTQWDYRESRFYTVLSVLR